VVFPEEELRQLLAFFLREQLRPFCEKVVFPEEKLQYLIVILLRESGVP
jgi:hypothetical protein